MTTWEARAMASGELGIDTSGIAGWSPEPTMAGDRTYWRYRPAASVNAARSVISQVAATRGANLGAGLMENTSARIPPRTWTRGVTSIEASTYTPPTFPFTRFSCTT